MVRESGHTLWTLSYSVYMESDPKVDDEGGAIIHHLSREPWTLDELRSRVVGKKDALEVLGLVIITQY